jgi:NAD(P)H-hydrate epimerase
MDNTFEQVKGYLPKRKNDSNKGSFGKTLLVCGSSKFPGAAMLASRAASSIGSGLTALSSPKEVFSDITSGIPEVTHVEFNIESILEESTKSNVLVIGPGLGTDKNVQELVIKLLQSINIPIVLDADGINVLEGKQELLKTIKNEFILTPHLKEFSRISGLSLDEILKNKSFLAEQFSKDFNCTLVLKGANTIITHKEKETFISPFANSALAKGGTGDILAGFIGGLIAQGVEPYKAACLGVYIHGKTAEIITSEKTEYSLLPQDLISYLPKTLKYFL